MRLSCHEHKRGALGAQQPLEPRFIEQHLLVCCVPEGPDLLFLAPGWKGPLPDGEGQQRFEVRGLGIAAASFPLAYGSARDTQQLSQARLSQPHGGAQGQHSLAKGIVCFTVEGSLHACAPFRPTHVECRFIEHVRDTSDGKEGELLWHLMDADAPALIPLYSSQVWSK